MSSRPPVRWAVVGLGHIAQVAVLPAFANAANSQLVALVSGDAGKRQAIASRYGVAHAVGYDGYDGLLAAGVVDAVYVATPNHLHEEHTVRAARAGVHVLCEKPLAVSTGECERMIAATSAAGVLLMTAYRLHFESANLEVLAMALDRELGEPRLFTSEFTQDVRPGDVRLLPVAQGGGPVYDLGVYCINAARNLFRAEPVEVHAQAASRADGRFADSPEMVSALLRFPGERLASFSVSFGAAPVSSYRLVGTAGSVRLSPAFNYSGELVYSAHFGGQSRRKTFPRSDQFGPQLVYFSRCIRAASQPEPDGWEGWADVRVVEAIHQSLREARPVALPPWTRQRWLEPTQALRRPPVERPEVVGATEPTRG